MRRAFSLFLLTMLFLMSRAYAAFEPRTSRCDTPENIPAGPGKLSTAIPSAYTKGSLLAMDKDWIAYADFMDSMKFMVLKRPANTKIFSDWGYDDLAAIIVDGDTVICLEGGITTDTNILEIFKDEETIFEYEFELPDGYDAWNYVSHGDAGNGTLLLLDDGTLLIMDTYGALYACGKDGSGLRRIMDTIIADFVYYDGMIY